MNNSLFHFFFMLTFGLGLAQTPKIDSTLVDKLINEAYEYEAKSPQKALDIYNKTFKISTDIDYTIGAFKSTMYSGIVKSNIAEYDSALYYYRKALPLSDKAKSIRSKALTFTNIGNVYQFKGELDSVPVYYLKAIKLYELTNDSASISNTFSNLSTLFETLNQTDKQIEYLEKAIKTVPMTDIELLGMCYGDLGLAYINKKKEELALRNFNLSDSISKLGEMPRLAFFNLRNFGEYYLYKESYKKAIEYYEKAIEKGTESSDEYYKNDLLLNLGIAHNELRDFSKASNYLKQALDMGVKSGAIEIQRKAALNLSKVFQVQGNFKNAYDYHKLYSNLKDSLVNSNKIQTINELETKYQSEKKDKEIAEQQLAIQESNSKTRTMAILMFSLLLGSILLWFSFRQRQKRMQQQLVAIEREQEVKTLESLMEGEEKERFRIAKELHDGVNGDLAAIKFKLSSLLETNNQVINEAVAMIDNSSEQVRAISHNLVPPSLRDFNLIEAVAAYCENMNAIHDPDISFQHVGNEIVLEKKQEANLFRIVQELVTNSIKHAEAKEIHVQLSNVKDNLQLTVEDDGKGFDVANIKSDGIGMQNVKSRVDYLGGLMDIKSDNKGTSFTFTITITDKFEKYD